MGLLGMAQANFKHVMLIEKPPFFVPKASVLTLENCFFFIISCTIVPCVYA
jgi:hypothetical protein